jgi:uncharacterized membrane protein
MSAVAIEVQAPASPAGAVAAAPARLRLAEVDRLRGLVIVLMALDHVRDYFSPTGDPTDLDKVSWELFLTRFVTRFCAPVFVFLSGTSAFLQREARGWTVAQLRRQLVLRGLLLIALELTWVSTSWAGVPFVFVMLQVIWAIGISMVVLGLLAGLPVGVIAALGAAIVLGHNALDPVQAESFGALAPLWRLVHEQGPLAGTVFVAYPALAWIGVMLLGYAYAPVLLADRRDFTWRRTLAIGAAAVAAFLLLRGFNLYGNPETWDVNARGTLYTALGWLDTEKYPPSLHYLLMTLGPALLALPLFARGSGAAWRPFDLFGRVPLFFYLIHIGLIHAASRVWTLAAYGTAAWHPFDLRAAPAGYEPSLLRVYVVWLAVLVVLYFACRRYAEWKARNPEKWLARWI